MGMFRLWLPYEDAYMLAWNGLVAIHTAQKLGKEVFLTVAAKASLLQAQNNVDPEKPEHRALASYFLSLALAGEGIHPILDRSPAKWFWLVDPFGANVRFTAHGDEVIDRVIRDLWSKHGVRPSLEPFQHLPETEEQRTSTAVRCIYCSEPMMVPASRSQFRVRCPACKGISTIDT